VRWKRQSSRAVKGASLKLMCVCFASSNLAFVNGRKKSDDALKNSMDLVSSVVERATFNRVAAGSIPAPGSPEGNVHGKLWDVYPPCFVAFQE
jgi:hypothetical protein